MFVVLELTSGIRATGSMPKVVMPKSTGDGSKMHEVALADLKNQGEQASPMTQRALAVPCSGHDTGSVFGMSWPVLTRSN